MQRRLLELGRLWFDGKRGFRKMGLMVSKIDYDRGESKGLEKAVSHRSDVRRRKG